MLSIDERAAEELLNLERRLALGSARLERRVKGRPAELDARRRMVRGGHACAATEMRIQERTGSAVHAARRRSSDVGR